MRAIIVGVALAAAIVLCLLHLAALRLPRSGGEATTTKTTTTRAVEGPAAAADPVVLKEAPLGPEVHVVFSTDCGTYQHWQSIAVWYAAKQAGHRGAVTRIASGCEERAKGPIEKEYAEIDDTGFFRVHFAPKGELKGNYKYSNKPSGLYHWLSTATPAPFEDERTGVVALIDPDQMLMRPLTAAVGVGLRQKAGDVRSMYDAKGVARVLVGSAREQKNLPMIVSQGYPVAQEYGLGGAWAKSGKPDARPSWRTFSRARVCGDAGKCTKTTPTEADQHYSVGPPYLIQATDARHLSKAWLEAVPEVHAQYPHLLAEMYAYAMAAANLSLPHAQLHNLMVSNVGAGGEAWDWIDTMAPTDVCEGATLSEPPLNTRAQGRGSFSNDEHPPGPAVPSVLHFCQSYRAGGQKFGKHSVPHNVFSCDQGLFSFDPAAITDDIQRSAPVTSKPASKAKIRNAFFLCNVIPRLNAALLDYKQTVCPKRGITTWNTNPAVKA